MNLHIDPAEFSDVIQAAVDAVRPTARIPPADRCCRSDPPHQTPGATISGPMQGR